MRLHYLLLLIIGGIAGWIDPARATHIVGGQIEMKAVGDKPGHFAISVTYYFDENQTYTPFPDPPLPIYRKRDNQYMSYVQVFNQTANHRPLLPFANQPCATQRNLVVSVVRYTGEAQLDPSVYNDPQGYYITYQTCCRNGGIDNIRDPVNAGYVFYLEFPPLVRKGKPFINSSPVFDPIDGEYICINEPFTFDFDARDPDGDELRYSLVTPLGGIQAVNGSQQVLAGPYPETHWLPGFSATNAIPGNPPLRIDARTGQLSVTANQLGLFIFTVLVEEFRQGERIGLVRRDYQLLVIDCPPTIPPDPTITVDNLPTSSVSFCAGNRAVLRATANADWAYQWKRDGQTVPGATNPTLTVTEAGTYQLTTTLKAQCSKVRRSQKITVAVTKGTFALLPDSIPPLCRAGGSVTLQSVAGNTLRHDWYRDGQIVPEVKTSTLNVHTPGAYWVVARDTVQQCQSRSDTVLVRVSPPLNATLSTPGGETAVCAGDSLRLSIDAGGLYRYQWQANGLALPNQTAAYFSARQTGQYNVQVTDSLGCQTSTPPLSISLVPAIRVRLDSIPPFCQLSSLTPIALQGTPLGGTFSGPGVVGASFNPEVAGAGQHQIRYMVNQGALGCQQGSAERVVTVRSAPSIDLVPSLATFRGGSVRLRGPGIRGYQYQWTPPIGLDDASRADALASPDVETKYTLRVTDEFGCTASDTIMVRLFERVWIPDAFSPNGDGLNDVWTLRGIDAYPDAEVTIYNRWGGVVFYSKGYKQAFDGRYQGQLLSTGSYSYVLKIDDRGLISKGTVIVL